MPKYLVNMNFVEAKSTNFIIEANDEDDIRDALGELDYTFFEKNCKWVSSDYEPPIIDNIEVINGKVPNKPICTKEQNKKIQGRFDKIMINFTKLYGDNNE